MTTLIIVATFFVVLGIILWIWLSVVWWSLKNGISPMPTTEKVKRKVLDSIPPETHGIIYDLGSGWGNVAIHLAHRFPQCQVIGYESSPVPYLFSKFWAFLDRSPNLRIYRKNFFSEDLSDATLIYCYLYPAAMDKLSLKFAKELKPGTMIFSNTFALSGWESLHVVNIADIYNTRVYMYMKGNTNIEALHAKSEELSLADVKGEV